MAKFFSYKEEDKKFFKDVVFLVEATSHEQFVFWQDYFNKPKYGTSKLKTWEQEGRGAIITIGTCDKRPVTVSLTWEWLDGYRVLFYYGASQVVDHKMIDDWIRHFSKDIKWDHDTRWAHCDSNNFHLCINAIQNLVKAKGLGPGKKYGI